MKKNIFLALLVVLNLHVFAGQSDSLLSDDPCNQKWHLEPQPKTIVFIGADSHPTRIAFSRSQLTNLQLTVDSDSNRFSIMSGLLTINGQWAMGGKKTLTLNATGDAPTLLVSGSEVPAFKGKWTAIVVNNTDRQLLLDFPDATYANLTYQFIGGAEKDNAPTAAPLSAGALKTELADAQAKLEAIKSNLTARLSKDPDYQAAAQQLDRANKAMQAANQGGDPQEIASAATKQMEAQVALDRLTQKIDSADPDYQAASDKVKELQQKLAAFGPLTSRKSWDITVVGKPKLDIQAIQRQIQTASETLRQLGPTETPPSEGWSYEYRRHHMLTPSEEDAITATNTRNAERQTAQRKVEALQLQVTQMQNARLATGTLDDGTGVSIFANGSAGAFVDSMQIGNQYTVKGSASMMDGVLRINLASAVPHSTASAPLPADQQ